ncbi:metallophosphoesterase [Candidatus Saccharibacteria bacterium CG_4_10_14_0_2_um_filter_52_9]|nr:MAG: metallophosphoesterase [Candidatus Saccharibacteria bacterium CG_4_10_14_0_2_um_filter_52_9]
MNILYVGDVMGESGIEVVERLLPDLRSEKKVDLVIAQAENTSHGKGITLADFQRLRKAGVDFCTGGNWSLHHKEIIPALSDPAQPIIRPANYPEGTPGLGWKYVNNVLVVSLLGQIVGKDADKPVDNPLLAIDQILESQKDVERVATIVNFHGDYSSEKVVIGHYLDGYVTAVIGDHWHVPTADARVLPAGTAHITDVGMCGVLDASLGVEFASVIPRWRDGQQTRNVLATAGPRQFNAVFVKVNQNGLAESIESPRYVLTSDGLHTEYA